MRGYFPRQCRTGVVSVLLALAPAGAPAAPAPTAHLLGRADLEGKQLHELELMLATPRARAGLVFVEWHLRAHFEKQSWYRPGRYDETRLTEVDRKNLATIESFVASIPRAVLLERWQALVRQHGYAGMPESSRLAFSSDGTSILSYPAPAMFGAGPANLWNASSGERLVRLAWPTKLVTRGYFPTPYGPRLGSEGRWPALRDARLIGDSLVFASDYHVSIGAPREAQPRRGLLIGPNWSKDGGREPGVEAACIAPDGATALTLQNLQLTSYDLQKGRALEVVDLSRSSAEPFVRASRCTFFDDSHALVGVEHDGDSFVYDVKARSLQRLSVPRGVSAMAPGGELLALWGRPGKNTEVSVWEVRDSPKQLTRLAGTAGATSAWFTPDRQNLWVAGARGALTLFGVRSGVRTPVRDDTTFSYPTTVPTGQLLPGLAEDTPEQLDRRIEPEIAADVAFSPDGTRVAIAYTSGRLEMRNASSGQRIPAFRGHDPWSEQELWEASLLARRLGSKFEDDWPRPPEDLNPLNHLAALAQPLPESAIEHLSRLDLRLLRNHRRTARRHLQGQDARGHLRADELVPAEPRLHGGASHRHRPRKHPRRYAPRSRDRRTAH